LDSEENEKGVNKNNNISLPPEIKKKQYSNNSYNTLVINKNKLRWMT